MMQYLNTFINLLAKTHTRDLILRFVQYASINSEDQAIKRATFNVYSQVRTTRKWLRFFRVIELVEKLRKINKRMAKCQDLSHSLLKLFALLQTFFKIIFYLFDHYVVLGEIRIFPKQHVCLFQQKSMQMYFIQNFCGALKSLLQIMIITQTGVFFESLTEDDISKGEKLIRSKSIEFLRNILDLFIACYYLNKPVNVAPRIAIIGMTTTILQLGKSMHLI